MEDTRHLVLVRHGQSEWNRQNIFTGWTDVPLSDKGEEEARQAGDILAERGYSFDRCFTSYLKRAIKTLWIVQERMDLMWLPSEKTWRLNERHYGDLQGRNKDEVKEQHGESQVFIWRRSYTGLPPALSDADERHPRFEAKYAAVPEEQLPSAESLEMTVARVMPFWQDWVAPFLGRGERLLICAHGNSLRGLVKYLDDLSDEDISQFELPTGIPLVYELNSLLQPTDRFFLREGS
jgi:2,3-bisphosphoglycerate-dependent phosphoglycerate mutase